MNAPKTHSWLWLLIAVFGIFGVLKATPYIEFLRGFIPVISILVPTVFAVVHGTNRLGARTMLAFFGITFIVSWCYESLSIATGFPFGHYHYTENLGPKLGTVPLLIMPAYFAMCYVSWILAHVVLDKWNQKSDQMHKFAIPLIASFIMVMWDMCMDPARATVKQAWIWHDGGGYFGVPFSNFLGWFLCVYTIFQLLAIYLIRDAITGKVPQELPADTSKNNWHQANALYAATSLEFVFLGFFPPTGTVTDAAQQVWQLSAMYESLGLVALFTMVFVSVLVFFKVQANPQLK
jgi:uncharacterized membrane protein